ncbi:MAG: cell division protein FtsZ, partial [Alphaproteobacteria bacterium]
RMHPNADTPFLPPKPMAAPEQAPLPAARAKPDPMAEAELMNAGKESPRRKGPSLFERVTGTGRARLFGGEAAKPTPPAAAKPAVEPSFSAPVEKPVAPNAQVETPAISESPAVSQAPLAPEAQAVPEAPAPAPTVTPPARQQALGGLEPGQAKNQDIEEDLLEIPAFLRRQAN